MFIQLNPKVTALPEMLVADTAVDGKDVIVRYYEAYNAGMVLILSLCHSSKL